MVAMMTLRAGGPTLTQAGPIHSKRTNPVRLCGGRRVRPAAARVALRCRAEQVAHGKMTLDPVQEQVSAFAPATVANLGPGFDWMGCAVKGEGDTVTARALPGEPGKIVIESIDGDGGRLTLEPMKNCCGIAAHHTLELIGEVSCGVALSLKKGLPLGSGMGSSAASAAAAAMAVNALFGNPVPKDKLVWAGLQSEGYVSGYHADNIAPATVGGFVLVRSAEPLDIMKLPFSAEDKLFFVLVNPKFEAPTAEMRAALPATVGFKDMISNSVNGGSLVAAILAGDIELMGKSMDAECVVEPARGPLIPGFMGVKAAAKEAGAYGCTISGAGPTAVAIVDNLETGEKVKQAMMDAFVAGGLEVNTANIVQLDNEGAIVVPDP